MRWLVLVPIACVLVGALAIAGAVRAYDASTPSPSELGPLPPEVAAQLSRPRDWRCGPVSFSRLDVDGDGVDDLYVETCRGDGYLTRRAGTVVYVDRGDTVPRPDGWWARQVFDGGLHLGAVGIGLVLFAFMAFSLVGPLFVVTEARR